MSDLSYVLIAQIAICLISIWWLKGPPIRITEAPQFGDLTQAELDAFNAAADLSRQLRALPVLRASDRADHVRDVHAIQHRILSRPTTRALRMEVQDAP